MSNTFQEKRDFQLMDSLVNQTPLVISGHSIVALINLGIFWDRVSHVFLLGWVAFLLLTVLVRWTMKIQYERHWQQRSPTFWRATFAVSSIMLGLMWCIWGLYVGAALGFNGLGLAILVITAAGLVSGAVASTSSSLVSYVLFTAPILLPLGVVLMLSEDSDVQAIGILMMVFFVITLRQVLQINAVLKQSITNGLELEWAKEQTERLANELYHQTTMDALTSIHNRRGFDEALNAEWLRAKRASKPLTLLMIDADCFKAFNDNFGHVAGDECLQQLASTLRSHVKRAGETIARFGGEEFAVLLPNTQTAEGVEIAEKIREGVFALNIDHPASDVADRVTVSAGVHCVFPHEVEDTKALIERADRALYQAMADGRNCVRVL